MAFGENVDPTAAIRAILDNYPFSVGLFREFLQNSDDARATKQVFLLDYRTHATRSLYHPQLASMQGPALLAYNDALFNQTDWNALQSIHRSSKKTDTSKIGKYGIGFRSCYHVTDSPQIISGSLLAILDPRHAFSSEGGVKLDLRQDFLLTDQLTPFRLPCIPFSEELPFPGSIIRLPLRTVPSSINDKPVVPHDIHRLLEDFIDNEIRVCLLFLENITSIEVIEIDVHGNTSVLALSKITRSESTNFVGPIDLSQAKHVTSLCSVETSIDGGPSTIEQWRIHHASFPHSDAASRLSQRAGCDPTTALSAHKLLPNVSIAAPLSIITRQTYTGRLYTYLPLPLPTGFPVHIHSLFALTQSRQNLRNHEEKGIVRGSADSILVEWNRLLFDIYIPHAWMCLITTLIEQDGLSDVFRAWPPVQGNQNGDAGYWKNLPTALLQCISNSDARIWPIVASPNGPSCGCLDLKSVVVSAWNNPDLGTLQALATSGVKITRPPMYIYKLLDDVKLLNALTPTSAHVILLQHVPELRLPSNIPGLPIILRYLLTGDDLHNLVGLPLIPLPDNRHISLHLKGSSQVHTMFEKDELEIFSGCENDPIALHLLDKSLATILWTRGPSVLNVQPLTPQTVVSYLTMDSSPITPILQTNNVSYDIVTWLSRFWAWIGSWRLKDQLFPLIQGLPLLPSSNQLKKTGSPIYTKLGVHPTLIFALHKLGIPFFHHDFSAPIQRVVSSFRPLSDLNSISDLLDSLDADHVSTLTLDNGVAQMLLKHFSRAHGGPLSNLQRQKLKKIPIFPLKQAGTRDVTTVWRSIPDDTMIRSVIMGTLWMLPVVQDTVFVDGMLVESSFLSILDPDTGGSLTMQDILKLSIQHFPAQSIQIQVTFMEYMAEYRDSISPAVFSQLRQTRFVVVLDESVQAPENVVDPQSVIAPLFLQNDNRFPRMTDKTEALVKGLQLLQIMQNTLTTDIVRERIQFISSAGMTSENAIVELSRRLLRLLYRSHFDCADLKIHRNLKWLPTLEGLLHPASCHDEGSHQKELFDHVLSLVEPSIRISPSLRESLGWNQPLPIEVLANQLSEVINLQLDEARKKIEILIKELSQRELANKDLDLLHAAIANRPWVPVPGGKLADTSHAVFSGASSKAGFYEIPFVQKHQRTFLLRMGCSEKPLVSVVIQDLQAYGKQSASSITARSAILLLKLLPPDISEEQRRHILVPDLNNALLPLDEVYYNDIGHRDCLIPTNTDLHIVHSTVSETLASKLRIQFLGLKFAEVKGPCRDMGEHPITTIRNKLRDYTEQQFLTEFVANAADAGATEFGILIDQYQDSGENTLSRAMEKFQKCPSLVIHNNAIFTDKDFDQGICETGRGGKRERTDTIGQFGSGALTMFHFSEVVTIVSGKRVMLLDPSREHLPGEDRVLSLSLSYVNRFYPDQLASLVGIFGFHQSCLDYSGTLFRLPLRNKSHIGGTGNSISEVTWTAKMIAEKIIQPFVKSAHEFFLFTKLQAIKFLHRDGERTTSYFSPTRSAIHEDQHMDGRYCSKIVDICCSEAAASYQKWSVVSTHVPREDFPSYPLEFSDKYHLRSPIIAGLAARLDSSDQTASHKFFSTLPLPVPNFLPVHVNAPFILSSDRRQIRFDAYDPLVSKYNQWLLQTVLPPLYLFLLADLLTHHGQNAWVWPGDAEDGSTHEVSQFLVSAFYQIHLRATEFQVFPPAYALRPLSPSEAILLKPGSSAVLNKVLGCLKPHQVAYLPSRIRSRAIQDAGIGSVTPLFVKGELLRYTGNLAPQLNWAELHGLLHFICKDDMKDLIGLPLLPLADGTFGTFEDASSCTEMYFISQSRSSKHLFLQRHFVHPKFRATSFSDLNITQLSVSGIPHLIQEIIPVGNEWNEMPESKREWVERFWSEFPLFQLDAASLLDCICSFPLVPTMQPGRYLSISECRDQSSVIIASSENSKLWDCLAKVGMTVVNPYSSDFPEALRKTLKLPSHSPLDHILSTLRSSSGLLIRQRFQRLKHDEYLFFAAWLRSQMSNTSKSLLHVARMLPIWPVVRRDLNCLPLFLPATEVVMLPSSVTPTAVKPFINDIQFTEYSIHLKHLGENPMSLVEFFDALRFPNNILPLSDIQNYVELLGKITASTNREISWVLVPNCNRVMCRSDTLYARDPLFLAAFGSASQHFVTAEARVLEPKLKLNFGLKCQHPLNIEVFRTCASAIDEDLSVDKLQRAEVIFEIYCQDLPLHISDSVQLWQSLNHLKFIPRANERFRWGRDVFAYVRNQDLPHVVAPRDIVLRKYEAVTWTQRVLCLTDPHQRILIANPSFGLPTTEEVVRHLYMLALQVSSDYPQDRGVLQDLRDTYAWLDEHSEDARVHMIQHHAHKLFLNVADPEKMTWEWHSADDLLLGIKESMHTFHPIHEFLLSFKSLLVVSGVQQLTHATLPQKAINNSLEVSPHSMRLEFSLMRSERQLIDVLFIPDAEDSELDDANLYAHRVYLATCSDYFKTLFTGDFRESRPASEEFPIHVPLIGHSRRCVGIVLDFLYKGVFDENAPPDLADLLEIMELSNYWGIPSLQEKTQYCIIPLITPLTVTEIERRAQIVEAHVLVAKCSTYRKDNWAIIGVVCADELEDS